MAESRSASESSEVWTVARILDWTTPYLKQHGSDTPRLDAQILLAFTRKCSRIELYTNYETPLTDAERSQMRDLVKRRSQAEPVAYLVGHREFFSLDFRVTKDVLIPRPDTETLVLEALERAKAFTAPRILDLCTGSGCIAVSLTVNLPTAVCTASDISPAAIQIATENAQTHKVGDRITFLEGDLFAALPRDAQFDLIVSNPPYIPEGEIAGLDADVRNHEPLHALQAGTDGMLFLNQIVEQASRYLVPGGWLALETGIEQAPLTAQALEARRDFTEVKVVKDAGGRPRVVLAQRVP
ncbi:MAG: peptide chain release factor N(5)-glutamine methyltransferase [Planctomycetota bacterium]